jgi:hypothetical protein
LVRVGILNNQKQKLIYEIMTFFRFRGQNSQ